MDHMNQDSGVLNGAVSFLWGNFRRNFGLNRCIPNSISAMFAWNRGPSADCVLEGVRAGIEGIGTLIAVAGGAKLAVIEESVQRIEQVFANAAGNPLGKDESNLIKEELTALVNNLTEEELHKRFETIARNIAPDDQERQTMIVDLLNVFASEVRQKAAPKAQPSGVDVGLTEMIIRLSNLAGQNRDKIESLLASTGEGEWATQIKGQLFKAFSPLLPDVNNTTDATIRTEL
jgi:hypothetical protein